MRHLLSIEFAKLKKLNSLKIIFLVYIVLAPLVVYGFYSIFRIILDPMTPGGWNPLAFPDIWRIATYSSSWFNVLMSIVVIIIVSNEYSFRTLKQNVIDGLSVRQVVFSKFMIVFILSTLVTIYTFVVSVVYGFLNSETPQVLEGMEYIGIYYLQTLGYFSFAFFFAVLIRKTALAIIFFVVAFIVDFIIGIMLSLAKLEMIYAFFPLNAFSKLTPFPVFEELIKASKEKDGNMPFMLDEGTNIALCIVYMFVFFLITYWVMRRRDL
jgi:ABC-type transport system involved in multi-copper enzyme maturation permease subunit